MVYVPYERGQEINEQLQSPAAGHTPAPGRRGCTGPRWPAARMRRVPADQTCVKVNANQLCQARFLQKEGFQYASLVSSALSPNADFIFAFYELERGNSFPWL